MNLMVLKLLLAIIGVVLIFLFWREIGFGATQ